MYVPDPHPKHPTPRYVSVGATRSGTHGLRYVGTTQERPGSRLRPTDLGGAEPSCQHLWCAVANLAEVAYAWADILRGDTPGAPDFDQLYLHLL